MRNLAEDLKVGGGSGNTRNVNAVLLQGSNWPQNEEEEEAGKSCHTGSGRGGGTQRREEE